MRKTWLLLFLGLFIVLLPFLGFPPPARTFLTVSSGVILFLVSFLGLRRFYRARLGSLKPAEKPSGNQSETLPSA